MSDSAARHGTAGAPAPTEAAVSDHAVSDYADQVLDVVERIPPGRVMSYGDVAEFVGSGGPRQVGRVMSRYGGGVPWWRVVHADGSPAPGHERAAGAAWRAEATPLRPHGRAVDMRRARWDGGAPHAGEQGL